MCDCVDIRTATPYGQGQQLLPLIQCWGSIGCKMLPQKSSGDVARYSVQAAVFQLPVTVCIRCCWKVGYESLTVAINSKNIRHIITLKLPTENTRKNFHRNQSHHEVPIERLKLQRGLR